MSLPTGGGAIRGIGEKFGANPATGTASITIPIPTSAGRSGFGPQLSLTYDSGSGNGPFGFGWSLGLPAITRKTDKGLPEYRDRDESDVFILSGNEDLVPVPPANGADDDVPGYRIQRYRPRTEGLFARIERWTDVATGEIHWRSISRDNVTTLYGKSGDSRIFDPNDPDPARPTRVFSWLISETFDDKGNAIVYEYAAEDDHAVDRSQAHERNRSRTANRYLRTIKYGNLVSRLIQPDLEGMEWAFQVVFDYDEGRYEALPPDPNRPDDEQHRLVRAAAAITGSRWQVRPDPFSSYRSAFEIRTYRRCQRVLMFHRFAELGEQPYLVRATTFDYADLDYANPVTIEAELGHQGSTRLASFIRSVTQSGLVRDATHAVIERDGVGYVTYVEKSLPPVELAYSKAQIADAPAALDADSLENLPAGLDGSTYQWVDLDGEGVSGILTEQAGAWFYKPNIGSGRFGPLRPVATKPVGTLREGRQQLLDLAGDGQLDVVAFAGSTPGFYERTADEGWETFRTFHRLPNIDWDDPNLRFVDLNGDGHADVLVTEGEVFTWYPSLAEDGFDVGHRVPQAMDEERGPRLVFADGTQSIYLADMSGDGLVDLVRIRNGEVSYWPNLGYGRFGAKVAMDGAPVFDHADQFEQRRVRIADIDGSGVTDIIYLGRDGIRLYFNQSGNRWSSGRRLTQLPLADNLSSVMTADLFGNGTACLIWSSPLPGDARRPLVYLPLIGDQKPHLLVGTVNNLGAETRVRYAPSTKFYLADKAAGRPWLTKLPFPVHVVERVETYDHVSRNRFVTRYAYHHGHFDGAERELRGFGMVEQWDTEVLAALTESGELPVGDNVDIASHVPPVHTKTWFHTGMHLGRDRVSNVFAGLVGSHDRGEYYREPAWRDDDDEARARLLADTILPDALTLEEEREACRALKGMMLRREVYAVDRTASADYPDGHPYIVTEQSFAVELVQPRGENRHAVFFAHPREAIEYHYERNPADPRITHTLTLDVDEYGNVRRSVAVGYARANVPERLPEQNETHLTVTLARFANVEAAHWRRIGVPVETRTYEMVKPPAPARRFAWRDLDGLIRLLVPLDDAPPAPAMTIEYEQWDWRRRWDPGTEPGGPVHTRLRPIEHVRSLYRPDDLGTAADSTLALLPLGTVESRAVPGESYKLAFTPAVLAAVYRRPLDVVQPPGSPPPVTLLSDAARMLGTPGPDGGGYVDLDANGQWWVPSGRIFMSPESDDGPAEEHTHAERHFFLPHRYRDPFHTEALKTETVVRYDGYDLLVVETRDPLRNRVTVGERDAADALVASGNDYRVLLPRLVTDPNRNRTAVAFDALGLVVATAVMSKRDVVPPEGDLLGDVVPDLTAAEIVRHVTDPHADSQALLGSATTRLLYDLFAYHRTKHRPDPAPAVVYMLGRETHHRAPVPPGGLRLQHSFSYSDGFGREIQKKMQAENGPVGTRDANGRIVVDADGRPVLTAHDVGPRWVGTGWTVYNNKGKPVRRYEPFFTDTHRFELETRIGVSAVLFYDPVERVVATLHPNHTWEKLVFDPWRQETWDVSDTVLADPRNDRHVGHLFAALPDADYLPTWHAARESGALGPQEQAAARKSVVHADTPAIAHADALGRTFLTVAHNTFQYGGAAPTEEFHRTRLVLDLEANQREVIDAKDRIVMRYRYDMLGNRVHQASMDAGERWTLNDAAGKALYAWDSMSRRFRSTYDRLRRPTDSLLQEGAAAELLVGRTVYGESQSHPEDGNTRGKVVELYDQAGVVSSPEYDFKGNLLRTERRLAREYKTTLDWSTTVPLEDDTYVSRTEYDALNRPTHVTSPDGSVVRPGYNEANLLERVDVNLRGVEENDEPVWTPFVTDIDYDADGRRELIAYGNHVRTTYTYDRLTSRLTHLLTSRDAQAFPGDCPQPPTSGWPGCQVQNLHYTYDAVGNITHIRDDAQQTIYFRNTRVDPSAEYTYDAVKRLIEATGREHLGQVGGAPIPHSYDDGPRIGKLHPEDGNALGRFLEQYVYDGVGNLAEMRHRGSDPAHAGWARTYSYDEPSAIEPATPGNRLSRTTTGTNNPVSEDYAHDAHGNMIRMPHLGGSAPTANLHWNHTNQARSADLEGSRQYYTYDSTGRRIRKIWEKAPGLLEERVYLGNCEIFRRRDDAGTITLERETLHVMDGEHRLALVETRTIDTDGTDQGLRELVRYQLGNQLSSVNLELDDNARIVSYEEYTAFGSTSYQAVRSSNETPKRYRFTAKERDEATGLSYHAARYYACWLGRWNSPDPSGIKFGVNSYAYCDGDPVALRDSTGRNPALALPLLGGAGGAGAGAGAGAGGAALASNPIGWAVAAVLVVGVVGYGIYRLTRNDDAPSTGSDTALPLTRGPMPAPAPALPGREPIPFPVPFPVPLPAPAPRPLPGPRPLPAPRPNPEPAPAPRPAPRPPTAIRPRPNPAPRPVPEPEPEPRPNPGPRPIPGDPVSPGQDEDPELDAYVVRAGVTTPEQLQKGTKEHSAVPGLTGFSVQSFPGATVEQLAAAGQFPNPQISVTTVRELMRIGVLITPSPGTGFHNTAITPLPLSIEQAKLISSVFRQRQNPAQVRR